MERPKAGKGVSRAALSPVNASSTHALSLTATQFQGGRLTGDLADHRLECRLSLPHTLRQAPRLFFNSGKATDAVVHATTLCLRVRHTPCSLQPQTQCFALSLYGSAFGKMMPSFVGMARGHLFKSCRPQRPAMSRSWMRPAVPDQPGPPPLQQVSAASSAALASPHR